MRRLSVRLLFAGLVTTVLLVPVLASATGEPTGSNFDWLTAPPETMATEKLTSDTHMFVFAEQSDFVLPTDITVDFSTPGTYDQIADLNPTTIAAGTVINSYYVHVDQVGEDPSQRIDATITFPERILGVILTNNRLADSRPVLGVSKTTYPLSGYEFLGACPPGSGQDCAILDADGRTLTLRVTDYNVSDDLRVITQGTQYAICVLYDQTKAHKSGSTVPIKLQLCDETGNNLSSAAIVVHATSVKKLDASASADVEDSGSANPDDNFRYDPTLGETGGYIFNKSTKGFSTGTWVLTFTVDGVVHSSYAVTFDIR